MKFEKYNSYKTKYKQFLSISLLTTSIKIRKSHWSFYDSYKTQV